MAQDATAAPVSAPETGKAHTDDVRLGLASAVGGFGLWGLSPVYWKWLAQVSALEIISHRIVWGALTLGIILLFRRDMAAALRLLRNRRTLLPLLATTALIAVNWLIFIWAVVSGRILEASLGYYINPLVSVALGAVVLRERLGPVQWTAVGLAALGVTVMAAGVAGFPWASLTMAFTFALYGLMRKMMPVGAAAGLFIETALCAPVALAFLLWLGERGAAAFPAAGWEVGLLLILSGPFTAAPLILFNMAARRIRLTTLGLIQYTAPTLQFLLAVLVYGEAFTPVHGVVFGLIWTGLALFSWDSRRQSRFSARV